ncbi:MAG: RnfH family protein [Legionella sp.]|nr:RnfH family protein [Legionella sp.]
MDRVELVYVDANKQVVHLHIEITHGTCVGDVLNSSGIWMTHPETKALTAGIFGIRCGLDTLLKPGDRVELYRALVSDPKEKRRERAK